MAPRGKKHEKVFVLLFVSILAVSLLVSCNSSPDSSSKNNESGSNTPAIVPVDYTSLVGNWRDSEDVNSYIVFTNNNTANTARYDSSKSKTEVVSTYNVTVSGDVVTFTKDGTSYSYKCTVSGNTITLVKESNSAAISEIAHTTWTKV